MGERDERERLSVQRRLSHLGVVITLLFALLGAQAINIMFFRANSLSTNALNPRVANASQMYPRGDIVAADGTVLAHSVATTSGYYPWRRVYPYGSLLSGVLGFSGPIYGSWGLESQYNSDLISHSQPPQSLSQIVAPQTAPNQLTLTLQPSLQRVAQKALAGRDGAVVALDPRTGAVLAMYSNPTYDPAPMTSSVATVAARYWAKITKRDPHGFPPLGLVATQETFAPGSTFKVITTASAYVNRPDLVIKSYPVAPFTTLPQSNLLLWNSGKTPCGGTIAQMLPPSCDPGYALLGLDLGGDALASTANSFGYNQVPPLDFPGIAPSYFPAASTFPQDQPGLAYSSIGQKDVRATALQNALVAAGIANHGRIMTPHFMSTLTAPDGTVLKRYKPSVWLNPLTDFQASQIIPLMQQVVRGGTAYGVFRSSDDVAAKTGTAQTGNSNHNTQDWMIAFAPASNPVVAVAVVVPFQAQSDTGAAVAGPVMRCVIEGGLALSRGLPASGTSSTCP